VPQKTNYPDVHRQGKGEKVE